MQSKNSDLRRYYREVRGWLPCSRKLKRRIIEKIDSVISVSEEELYYGQIIERYGTPQQIAAAYVDEMGTEELLNDLRIKRKIVRVISASCVIVLVMWLGCIAAALVNDYHADNGYIERIVTTDKITSVE